MAESDRTDNVIDRIRASRSARNDRDLSVRERARAAHERARETLSKSIAHWERKRAEVRGILRQIEERREHRARRLVGMATQMHAEKQGGHPAPEQRHIAHHQHAEVIEAKARAARAVERVKEARKTTHRKGSGKK